MCLRPVRPSIRWAAQQIEGDYARRIADWPSTREVDSDDLGKIVFCHATPRSDVEIITWNTPASTLRSVLVGVSACVVVCGHTHMQFDRRAGPLRVLNAGSVGMPFGDPGAYWLLLDGGARFQRTEYDLEKAAIRIRESDFPGAAAFADRNVLAPPSEAEMLEVFDRAARRSHG